MEYIDVLDENGNKTGIVKSRADAHRDGDWHKVAFVFVVNDKGEIILQKRSPEKQTNPNKWTASASGHLSSGDSDIEGALRELEEEIGVKATEDELQYLCTVKYQSSDIERNLKISHIINVYLLFKNIKIEELVLQDEEVSEAKYVYFKDFEKMINTDSEDIVKHNLIYPKVLQALHEKFD